MIARRLVILGRVQGVGFRASMMDAAQDAGVDGWVRNCPDGTVEAWVQGEPAAVERVITWAERGPPLARVTRVDVSDVAPQSIAGFGYGGPYD
jgi:acylphosphatase